jgi:hypothetical protein
MKFQIRLILFTALIAIGCTDDKSSEREKTYNELSFFVDRVESELLYRDEHNWPKIAQQYKRLEKKAEDAWRKVQGEDRKALDELEIRYETIEADEKRKKKKLRDRARFHMNNLEIWYRLKSTDIGNDDKEQIADAGARQSIHWFKENYYRLEFRTQKRYDDNMSRWGFDF